MKKDFDQFLEARKQASDEFLKGNVGPLQALSAKTLPASIFGPKGDCINGASAVDEANAHGSQAFTGATANKFQILHTAVDNDLAYWVGIQRSVVQMKGADAPIPMDLRITEIFRREDGEWKLVHRHADKLDKG